MNDDHFISCFHFIFIFLTTVAPSISIDCFAGGRAKINIIYKFKTLFTIVDYKKKKEQFQMEIHKKDYQPSMTSFCLLLKVKREGASLTSDLNWFQILGPQNEIDF